MEILQLEEFHTEYPVSELTEMISWLYTQLPLGPEIEHPRDLARLILKFSHTEQGLTAVVTTPPGTGPLIFTITGLVAIRYRVYPNISKK